jgi:hypothetical protein
MEHEVSLPHLKVAATCPYPEPVDITLIKRFNKYTFNGADLTTHEKSLILFFSVLSLQKIRFLHRMIFDPYTSKIR